MISKVNEILTAIPPEIETTDSTDLRL